jgi:predicted DNA-binding transcriptional regulator YafY
MSSKGLRVSVQRIQRLLRLITTLQSGSARTSGDLMLELGVSRRTLFRDLEAVHQAGIPCHHKAGQGYRMAPSFFLPPINLTVPETLGLMLLGKTAAGQSHHPMLGSALAAIHKLVSTVPNSIRGACADLIGPVSVGEDPHSAEHADARYYTMLLRCIDEGRVCAMTYPNPVEPGSFNCHLEPLGLHLAARFWYVLGRTDLHPKEVCIFKVTRIHRLEPTDQMFPVSKSFRVPQRFRNAWQLDPEGHTYHIELEFTAQCGVNVAEVIWHPSQKHQMLSDGRCVMSFDVDGIRGIARWICGYADEVVVRCPVTLRDLVVSMHQAAAKRAASRRTPHTDG